ncbi:hypothetical protein BX666DRAFT_1888303 [Dichotomocladium elegans]|nr:hypothetical protein BX666DRAFT_1888303 [Dichotomocladium elegans]
MKHQFVLLLLVHILAIVGRAAVIPLPPKNSDLQSEAVEFLDEDAYRLENPTTVDEQNIIDDNEDNSELQHTHAEGEEDIVLVDVEYVLDMDGRTFVVAEQPAEGETVHDPGLHVTEDQSTPSSSDEDAEDEEYVFEDDEESLNQELVIDPETGMPLFKNKDDSDFDSMVNKWIMNEQVDSVDFYDDDQDQLESAPRSPFPFAFFPNNWRVLMAIAGLGLVIKLLRIGKNKVSIQPLTMSESPPKKKPEANKQPNSAYK